MPRQATPILRLGASEATGGTDKGQKAGHTKCTNINTWVVFCCRFRDLLTGDVDLQPVEFRVIPGDCDHSPKVRDAAIEDFALNGP